MKIFVINPGSTSTKLALYENEKQVFVERSINELITIANQSLNALTEKEVGEITAWYESLDTAKTYNSDVMDIIQEEASAYFDGNMDVETVASNIQNRVQMLLYEGM